MKISYYPGCTLRTKAKELDVTARLCAKVLGVEMESAALYCNAARAGKKALCICTVSDYFPDPSEKATIEERQSGFTDMMKLALDVAAEMDEI